MKNAIAWAALLASVAGTAQTKKPFQSQTPSSISYAVKDGIETVEFNNVAYDLVGNGIPGRPPAERLILRKTSKIKQEVDAPGMQAMTTIEAWPLGVDLKQKPLYTLLVDGIEPQVLNNEVIVVSRGLEETDWWSVFKLGNGHELFDTYVPLVHFSIARDIQTLRYVGYEVPEDDAKDSRLRAPNVIGVLTYASAERVIREALITCDDPKRAVLLRSFADASRTIAYTSGAVRLSISQNYPSAPATVTITIPVAKDDLDTARTQAPAGLHAAVWKR